MNTDSSKAQESRRMTVDELRSQLQCRYENSLIIDDLIVEAIKSGKITAIDGKGEEISMEGRHDLSLALEVRWVQFSVTRERDEDSVIGKQVSPRILLWTPRSSDKKRPGSR